MANYTSMTKSALVALLVERDAKRANVSEASAHYAARDIPCSVAGDKCVRPDGTVRTFRTADGLAGHVTSFGTTAKKHDNKK